MRYLRLRGTPRKELVAKQSSRERGEVERKDVWDVPQSHTKLSARLKPELYLSTGSQRIFIFSVNRKIFG